MKAMRIEELGSLRDRPEPLRLREVPIPVPTADEVLLRLSVCGVCHTELDEVEGRMAPGRLPVTPGHQAVGEIVDVGENVRSRTLHERVGVAWIYSACGACEFCRSDRENLCPDFRGAGCDSDGGYAEYLCAPAAFALPIPPLLGDAEAAPLLCAGAIGYRSVRLSGIRDGQRLGLTGFGASAHLVLLLAQKLYPGAELFVFARSESQREFALALGAHWAGATDERAPAPLHAVIDTTPAWKPIVEALANLTPGGRLVINAIRKEANDQRELLQLDYPEHLWREKEIKSVANVTRRDVSEFLELAAQHSLKPQFEEYPLTAANEALHDLKAGRNRGAKVLRIT